MRRFMRFLMTLSAAAGLAGIHTAAAARQPAAIDEGRFIDVNGQQQWVTIRSRDAHNPVLLLLHGGPGFAMSFLAPLYDDWTKDFTIVQWDQPLSGATYLKNRGLPPGPLTVDRYVKDGLAVAEWARKRLGVKKVLLVGTSWGSLLGVEMVQRRPDLFSAYVGAAQAVGPKGNVVGYDLALDAARKRGDTAAVEALTRVGPPPYAKFEDFMVRQRYANAPGLPPTPAQAAAMGEMINIAMHPDPRAHYNAPMPAAPSFEAVLMEAQQATWRETWSWDAHHLGTAFKVPVFIFQGDMDFNTPTAVARAYFDEIKAPAKGFEIIPGAGHDIILFHAELLKLLERDVLPIVRQRR